MFEQIFEFISLHSYGPISARVCDVGNLRFIQIDPYNYYVVQDGVAIYVLLPASVAKRYECMSGTNVALKFKYGEKNKIVCSQFSVTTIITIFQRYGFVRVSLVDDNGDLLQPITNTPKSVKIHEIINKCIRLGLLTI